jgi:hypothetical protein
MKLNRKKPVKMIRKLTRNNFRRRPCPDLS